MSAVQTGFAEGGFSSFTLGDIRGRIGVMSAVAKSRIDPELKRQAEAVLEGIGLKPRAALELFYRTLAEAPRVGGIT